MDMKSLLNSTASAVTAAVAESDKPLVLPPIASLPVAVTPTSFLAPSYAPPAPSSSSHPKSFSAAAFQQVLEEAKNKPEPVKSDAEDSEEEFDEDNPEWAKWDCDQIRRKIRAFLRKDEMTQTAWLRQCDINSNSYYRFMKLKGPYSGNDNQTFEFASIFFYRRERDAAKKKLAEKSKPVDKKRKAAEQLVEKEKKQKKAKKSSEGAELLQRIADTKLEDEDENGDVPVFDDCDEIRRKINAFLRTGLVTKAAFLRALGNVNSNSLRSFLGLRRGAGSGAANVVYRKAFIFFEKKRILEGKKKSDKRLDNEAAQGPTGFPLRHDNGMRIVFVGDKNW